VKYCSTLTAVEKFGRGIGACHLDGRNRRRWLRYRDWLLLDTGHRKCEFDRIQASNREILEFGLP